MEHERSRNIKIFWILLVIAVTVVGVSFAFFFLNKRQGTSNVISTLSCLDVGFTEDSSAINLKDAIPISDEEGITKEPFKFTVTNNCSTYAKIYVLLDSTYRTSTSSTYLNDTYLKVNLSEKNKKDGVSSILTSNGLFEYEPGKSGYIIKEVTLEPSPNGVKSFDFRMWLDVDTTIEQGLNKQWAGNIVVVAEAMEQPENNTTLASLVELGDYITVTPTLTSAVAEKTYTGYSEDITYYPSELKIWRVINKNEDGTVDVVSDNSSSTSIYFQGEIGYKNYVGYLNTLAANYTNETYVHSTRHTGYDGTATPFLTSLRSFSDITSDLSTPADQISSWESTGGGDIGYLRDKELISNVYGDPVANPYGQDNPMPYLLASRVFTYYKVSDDVINKNFGGRFLIYEVMYNDIYSSNTAYDYFTTFPIRPILTLKSTLRLGSGDGESSSTPYTLQA